MRLFGSLCVLKQGKAVALPASKKSRALLAMLVLSQRAIRRDRLCDLFWQGPDDPRAALRWSLAKLRPLVDEPGVTRLVTDREEVRFELHGMVTDWHTLQSLKAVEPERVPTQRLNEAIELVQGELLEGLDLCDCHQYHEWHRAEREAARRLAARIRLILIDRLRDDPHAALIHARALTAADPLDQEGHAAVIRILGSLGRTKDALEQYDRCRRILRTELQSTPSAQVERARMELGRLSLPSREPNDRQRSMAAQESWVVLPTTETRVPEHGHEPSRSLQMARTERVPPPQGSRASLPLIGREAERARFEAYVTGPGLCGPELLLLLGEPGLGKSRMLQEVAAIAQEVGGRALMGRAFEAEMVRPYGAWLDALRMLDPELLDANAPRDERYSFAVDLSGDRGRFFEAVIVRLKELDAIDRTTVIIFDDVQWMDEASAALFHYALRALSGSRVRFACAARPGELGDNFPVLRLFRAVAREGHLHQVQLALLDAANTAQLAATNYPGVDGRRVYAETGGNPLYVLEVARALSEGQQSTRSLQALLDDRLVQLQGTSRALVSWAAVFGGPFLLSTLQGVSGLGTNEFLLALDEIERHGFFRPVTLSLGIAGVDFAHDLMRSAAYQAMSEPKRRLMHLAVARALSQLPDSTGAQAGDVAHHADKGDDALLAARYGLIAAERSLRLFAAREAVELADRALAHVARLDPAERAPLEIRLLRILIVCDVAKRRSRELEQAMRQALSHAQSAECQSTVTLGLLAMAHLYFELGDLDAAQQLSLRVSDVARRSREQQAVHELAHAAQCLALVERDMEEAESLARDARALADQLHGEAEVFVLLVAEGFIHSFNGRLDECVVVLERAAVLAEQQGAAWLTAVTLLRLATSELQRGRPARALQHCARLQRLVASLGEGSEGAYGETLAMLARRELHQPAPTDDFDQALGRLEMLDAQAYLADVNCLAAESDVKLGDLGAARRRAQSALRSAKLVRRASATVWAHAILAQTHLLVGDRDGARKQTDEGQLVLARVGRVSALARMRLTAVVQLLASLDAKPSRLSIN